MKRIIVILLTIVSMCSSSWAGVYYVDSSSGNDSNPGTLTNPWKTIGKANSTLVAGDVVNIRSGTYSSDPIAPKNSGASGNYITYQQYPSETAILKNGTPINLAGKHHIIVDGISVGDASTFILMDNTSYSIIRNCNINGRAVSWQAVIITNRSQYNQITGNTIKRLDGDKQKEMMSLNNGASYNLVNNNDLYGGTHGTVMVQKRSADNYPVQYNIIRNNIVEPYNGRCFSISGPLGKADHNVIEYNTFKNQKPTPFSPAGMSKFASNKAIYRFNVFHTNTTTAFMLFDARSVMCDIISDNRFYNNTMYDSLLGLTQQWIDSIGKRNKFYNNISQSGKFIRDNKSDATLHNNNLLDSSPNDSVIYSKDNTWRSASYANSNFANFANNISTDPMFESAKNKDFHLQADSPCIDKGRFLTSITSASGSGTSFVVDDSLWFIDGFGIVDGDRIQLEGETSTAKITNINYTTNTITVNTELTWDKGQGVFLAYQGAAPDIGAFEYGFDRAQEEESSPSTPEDTKHCCLYYEAEDMTLSSPMVKENDETASGGGYIRPSLGENSTSPVPEATYQFTLPKSGTYYLWISINGIDYDSNALYVGIDNTWDRVFANTLGVYEWLKVEISDGTKNYGFNLSAGSHTLRIGHGEINARADAVYLSNDPNEAPAKLAPPVFVPQK